MNEKLKARQNTNTILFAKTFIFVFVDKLSSSVVTAVNNKPKEKTVRPKLSSAAVKQEQSEVSSIMKLSLN